MYFIPVSISSSVSILYWGLNLEFIFFTIHKNNLLYISFAKESLDVTQFSIDKGLSIISLFITFIFKVKAFIKSSLLHWNNSQIFLIT